LRDGLAAVGGGAAGAQGASDVMIDIPKGTAVIIEEAATRAMSQVF
jgi:hypothetical protein